MPVRFLVIGPGAVGGFYGSRIATSPHTLVSALCRSNYKAVRDDGFNVRSPKYGSYDFKPEHTFASAADAKKAAVNFDYLLVATKALPEVTDDSGLLEGLVGADTSIVLVQNGLGIEEPYRKRFPRACILSAVTIASVAQPKAGQIQHNGWTRISIGPYAPQSGSSSSQESAMQSCTRLVELLKAGGISDAEAHDHAGLQFVRWHKIAINSAMNPSAVLSGGTTNQDMANDSELSRHLIAVMQEVLDTAPKVLGKPLPSSLPSPEEIMHSIKRNNSGNKPSMLIDWEKGNRMELEVILGNPIRIAREHGVDMPRLQAMYALLKMAQEHQQRRNLGRL